MVTPVHTPVPPRTPVFEVCPPVPDIGDMKDVISYKNLTLQFALQPSVKVATPIIMMSVGICCNIIAVGVFTCSRTAHREHAFYGILRGMLYTNIVSYLEIYPIVILGHMNGLHWIGSSRLCKFHGIAILNYGLCVAYLTGALAWERFLATCRPGTYDKKIEKRKIPYIIALMWIVSLFTSLLPLAGFGRFTEMYPNTWCFLDWRYEETVGRLFCSILATAVSAICLFLLSTLVVSTGICVYRTYEERRNKLPMARNRVEMDGYVGNCIPHNGRSNGQLLQGAHRHMDNSNEDIPHGKFRSYLCWATFQYSLIASSFFICYIPIVIRIISNVSGRPENLWADLAAIHSVEFYPICLPVIYVFFHKQLWYRITRYKKTRRHGQVPVGRYQQHPLGEGRDIHDVQRYQRYNYSNHLSGSGVGNNIPVNHYGPRQCVREENSSSKSNHVDNFSPNERMTAERNKPYPGWAKSAETVRSQNQLFGDRAVRIWKDKTKDKPGKRSESSGNCRTDASLESLLASFGPGQHASQSSRFLRPDRSTHFHDDVDITVLERLMDNTEKNHKSSNNITGPRRLESVI